MTLGAGWFLLELHGHGAAGFVERLLTGAQAIWPLTVVVACVVAGRLRHRAAVGPPVPLPAPPSAPQQPLMQQREGGQDGR
jgi:hypothetical protein